jgi:hypothetical protein
MWQFHIYRNSELQVDNEALKEKQTQKTEEIDSLQVMKNLSYSKFIRIHCFYY